MRLENVGEIIALRSLALDRPDKPAAEIIVLLGKPLSDGEQFYCPYQIKGAGDEKVRCAHGVDAFQALQLALPILGVHLQVLNKELGGGLRWESGEENDFGFPSLE